MKLFCCSTRLNEYYNAYERWKCANTFSSFDIRCKPVCLAREEGWSISPQESSPSFSADTIRQEPLISVWTYFTRNSRGEIERSRFGIVRRLCPLGVRVVPISEGSKIFVDLRGLIRCLIKEMYFFLWCESNIWVQSQKSCRYYDGDETLMISHLKVL